MTMFEELYALATGATLTLVLSADEATGKLTVNVIPKPKKEADETALTKALSLTATPAEFDADFVTALKGYREERKSLMEQAEATREILQAAKTASAKKAGEAVAKAAKPSTPAPKAAPMPATAPAQSAGSDHDHNDDDDEEGAGGSAMQPPATAAATSGQSFDLFG